MFLELIIYLLIETNIFHNIVEAVGQWPLQAPSLIGLILHVIVLGLMFCYLLNILLIVKWEDHVQVEAQ